MSHEFHAEEIEIYIDKILHPLNLFKGWSLSTFREWLHIDKYGNTQEQPDEKCVLSVLNMIEPFAELGKYYDICLEELIKINKNESSNKPGRIDSRI